MTNEEKILEALVKMQTQMDGMQTRMDGMQTRMDSMQAKMDARFEKLEANLSAVRILVDVDIEKKLNLLSEGHQTLLETLAPKNRVEQLEEEVSTLKTVVRILAEKVDTLGAAG